MIEVTELSKSFDNIQALQQVSATIQKGSIFGLIGSNGAGKSTFCACWPVFTVPMRAVSRLTDSLFMKTRR